MKPGDYQTEAQARDYHYRRFKGGLAIVHRQETKIISRWIKKIAISDKSIVADIGAGTGRIIGEVLKNRPKKVFAIDVSSAMLNQLSKIYQPEISADLIEPLHSSASRIPLKKNSVDLATSLHLFKHLDQIEPAIASVADILKPKGYFIFDVLNPDSLIRFNLQSCHAYPLALIKEVLREEGLVVKEVIYLQNFGETIYRIVGTRFSEVIYLLDKAMTRISRKLGTKMLILAQKI